MLCAGDDRFGDTSDGEVKKFWILVAGLCGVAAVVFLWREDYDKAFFVAALGAIAWFLNYRTQLVANRAEDDEPDSVDDDEEDQL